MLLSIKTFFEYMSLNTLKTERQMDKKKKSNPLFSPEHIIFYRTFDGVLNRQFCCIKVP